MAQDVNVWNPYQVEAQTVRWVLTVFAFTDWKFIGAIAVLFAVTTLLVPVLLTLVKWWAGRPGDRRQRVWVLTVFVTAVVLRGAATSHDDEP